MEDLKVRFVIDPEELEELGIDPRTVLGGSGPQAGPSDSSSPDALTPEDKQDGGGGLSAAAMTGAVVGGLLGILDMFKQLLSNSKLLNTYAQSFGKVFSAALDILLAPFIPVLNLMLAGLLKLVAWLIDSGYLEKMSYIVDAYIVPALEMIGAGLERLWDAMNHSLNPMNWDWGKLGKMAAADLLANAAFILAGVEALIDRIPGIKLDAFREGDTGPLAMFNAARGMVGSDAVQSEQFETMFKQWLASVGIGAGAGTVLPGLGSGSGAALGGLGYGAGALYAPSDVPAQVRMPDVYGDTPVDAGHASDWVAKNGPTRIEAVNVTVNVNGSDDSAVRQTAEEQAQQHSRDAVQQIAMQP